MPINPVWLRWPSPAAVPRLPWRPIKFGVLFTLRIIFYWDTQKCRITFCSSVDCPAKKQKRNRSFEWLEVGALQEDSEETLWENVNFTALEMSGVVRSCVRGLTRRMALPQSQKTTEIPRTRYSSPIVFNAVKNCRRVFFGHRARTRNKLLRIVRKIVPRIHTRLHLRVTFSSAIGFHLMRSKLVWLLVSHIADASA